MQSPTCARTSKILPRGCDISPLTSAASLQEGKLSLPLPFLPVVKSTTKHAKEENVELKYGSRRQDLSGHSSLHA